MKEASPKAQEQQYNIDNDIPTPIKLGKRTFMVKDLKQYVSSKISVLIAKKNGLIQEDGDVILKLNKINTLSAKVLSMAILGSNWKIFFFHQFLWRYIHHNCTEKEINIALGGITEKLQLGFFLQNMIYVESLNQMRIHLTKEEALSYQAELISGKKQTS